MSVKVPGTQTNNNAEIFSTIKAIDLVKATGNFWGFYVNKSFVYNFLVKQLNGISLCLGLNRISIHTDSDFVIKSINEWMPRWKVKGWKTSTGTAVKNKEMFILLNQRIESMDSVSWVSNFTN